MKKFLKGPPDPYVHPISWIGRSGFPNKIRADFQGLDRGSKGAPWALKGFLSLLERPISYRGSGELGKKSGSGD